MTKKEMQDAFLAGARKLEVSGGYNISRRIISDFSGAEIEHWNKVWLNIKHAIKACRWEEKGKGICFFRLI